MSLRFGRPDALIERARGTTLITGHDPILLVPGRAGFVRVLLEARLTGERTLLLGTWLEVEPNVASALVRAWDTPAYSEIVVDGLLANAIPPWGLDLLGAPARAAVANPDQLPFLVPWEDGLVSTVLTRVWAYDAVADALLGHRTAEN